MLSKLSLKASYDDLMRTAKVLTAGIEPGKHLSWKFFSCVGVSLWHPQLRRRKKKKSRISGYASKFFGSVGRKTFFLEFFFQMSLWKFVKNSLFHIVVNTGNNFSPFLKCFQSFKMSFSTFESQLHRTLQNFSIDLIEQFIIGYALTHSKTCPCFYLSAVHVF